MEIVKTIEQVRKVVSEAGMASREIGLVPTMGALHEGHFSLIKAAKKQCDFVAVSIFVNPTQFGPGEDLAKYPRPFDADVKACKELGVDIIFAPSDKEMYPEKNITWVNVEKLSEPLCGKSRPGHFRGVATVCAKLFNIVQPDVAFFGQKDAQQAVIIQRMVADLNMPMEIVVCPTVRQIDGLAMSSRNKYLNDKERKDAALLYAALQEAEMLIGAGVRKSSELVREMEKILKISKQIKVEYISIVNAQTLDEIDEVKGKVLIAIAAKLGSARLIDNIMLDVE
ncbi:MAG: pantoate--beta-alanine ligase [Planctomycetes bacterium]|nr:pantoate--beta-alanine ligase [Planctomycetota bacterium]MBU1518653.1 pantoate--beta-alanine ligase [Planctomycetota bacterium]MBU2458127.1 pantoate--beta-alanine ligase [Planctomycetota bacterium]